MECRVFVPVAHGFGVPPFSGHHKLRKLSLGLCERLPVANTSVHTRGVCLVRNAGATAPARQNEELQRENEMLSRWEQEKLLACCEPGRELRVAVLLSGGVDSSVALRLLCEAGHSCTAFYLKIWFQEDFENFWFSCPWEEDLRYAQEVCDEVGVKLEILNLTDVYWSRVVSKCIGEVEAGRTPNPDILCNSIIKFGAFLEHIDRNSFDRVASGHYARVEHKLDGRGVVQHSMLKLSKDEIKDQTYFLSQLTQEQLQLLMFPLGRLKKTEVRQLAEAMNLPNKDRKDSQGICFLGKVKFSEFISQHLGEREGLLLEAETGKTMGTHKGFWFYTIGQRRGISLSHGPWYVVAKDTEKNIVYISRSYFSGDKQRHSFHVNGLNWLSTRPPEQTSMVRCKVRHGPSFYDCKLEFPRADNGEVIVRLTDSDQALAAGQYAAFYDDSDTCLGSGVITDALNGLESCTVSSRDLEAQVTLEANKRAPITSSTTEGREQPPNAPGTRIEVFLRAVAKWIRKVVNM